MNRRDFLRGSVSTIALSASAFVVTPSIPKSLSLIEFCRYQKDELGGQHDMDHHLDALQYFVQGYITSPIKGPETKPTIKGCWIDEFADIPFIEVSPNEPYIHQSITAIPEVEFRSLSGQSEPRLLSSMDIEEVDRSWYSYDQGHEEFDG